MRQAWWMAGLCLISLAAMAEPALNFDSVTGVYKWRHRIQVYEGPINPPDEPIAEDALEIVKLTPDKAYVRIELARDNGHGCSFPVVMRVQSDTLTYRRVKPKGDVCELRLRFAGGKVIFADKDNGCRELSCSARGYLDGASFEAKSRRPIRYMKRLLASYEYASALKEDRK